MRVFVLGWCLITNQGALGGGAEREDSLAGLLRRIKGRYAQYLNAGRRRTGHLWQNHYFSCSVAAEKEEIAPSGVVRAAMLDEPEEYKRSSAPAHLVHPWSSKEGCRKSRKGDQDALPQYWRRDKV